MGALYTGNADSSAYQKSDAGKLHKEIKELELQIEQTKDKVVNEQGRLSEATQTFQKLQAEKKAAEQKESQRLKALEEYVKSLNLNTEFQDIKISVADLRTAAKALNSRLDNAILGAYLRSRMAKLLTSDVLCEQAKSCDGGKQKTKNLGKDQLNQIFTETKSNMPGAFGTEAVVE